MTAHDLTPVQEIAGMYFKRDDLYTPFGAGGVNGGKLRQCMLLVEAAYIAVTFSFMGLLAGMLANGSFHLGDWQTWLVFGAYVLCVLFEQFNMVHSYMMRSIALDPSEVTRTLSVGLSVDHMMAIVASPIMGVIWEAWGVQYVFYLAALSALLQVAAAAMTGHGSLTGESGVSRL